MRSLILMRHAATEDARPGAADHARRLTPTGERDAAAAGDHLRGAHTPLDLVICSSAVRARQTAEALRVAAPVVVSDLLYNAGGDEILQFVRELEDDVAHVLVIGHAPGMPSVAHELADPRTSDPQALAVIERRFPAGALATLNVSGPWSDLDRAVLVSIHLP